MERGQNPADVLASVYRRASGLENALSQDREIVSRITLVARNLQNRACVRVILACCLEKVIHPEVDIRKPYTEINAPDAYSGRSIDEKYITHFIHEHNLPCNPTTAWLTPALRNRNTTLTPDLNLVGRPANVYKAMLLLLTDVHEGRITAEDLLVDTVRQLIIFQDEREQRMQMLKEGLKGIEGATALSSEEIVTLVEQHLNFKRLGARGSSRLPVIVVASAYQAASTCLGERFLPLESHTAADLQTGSLGDLEITLMGEDNVVTSYEMKARSISRDDIDGALQKIERTEKKPDNYIFITTELIDSAVQEYAVSLYGETGVEFVILDCIGFLRHFLHLFHRIRMDFLNAYQDLLLAEPESAITQPLKEAFLAMRQAAESGE